MKLIWMIPCVVACGGKGGGDADWSSKPVKTVTDKVNGVGFSIDLPEGLTKDAKGGSDITIMWEGTKGEGKPDFKAPHVMVSFASIPATTLDDYVKDTMPGKKDDVVRKDKLPDGYIVTLQGQSKGIISVHVARQAGEKMLDARCSQADDDGLPNLDATRAWLEKICLSLAVKK